MFILHMLAYFLNYLCINNTVLFAEQTYSTVAFFQKTESHKMYKVKKKIQTVEIAFTLFLEHRVENEIFGEEFETKLTEFCPWIGAEIQVFDANGDGYDDLTCHTSTGIIQITESHLVDQRTGRISEKQSSEGGSVGNHGVGAPEKSGMYYWSKC